jgi:hypothetical protein
MRINEIEMVNNLLNKMTVDMTIEFCQTKECAIASVDIILWNVLNEMELSDEEVSEENLEQRNYWRNVKEILKSK